ncbi:cation:proton antiporter [Corynebacterium uberis]|uniref:cation:proton antiporter n=1 Tax=Corynebacterium TaxID=1716 RepID=UPI001D0B5CF7|nr:MULTISPECIES: cation:proton antiporter [Corynebacterium]MCZ9309931.1 cation:proton antiporter [Corynebacterium sp. c6VSa_13]UDL73148.1 cation:proton antiporter [Corynebacterium uberis]UDL75975.1 cation:proton antiporter [Corynebacterium uberis]UDL78187.1 cation:proton antiporter [Corynebacterium uberis]UDL80470.1 cation:proton antiporter [Corynebacterium uberis]
MTPFALVLTVAAVVILGTLVSGLVLILVTGDFMTRAILSDLIFYSMLALYLLWCLDNQSSIAYEIAILTGIAGGVLPTLSMSRMVSQGRR